MIETRSMTHLPFRPAARRAVRLAGVTLALGAAPAVAQPPLAAPGDCAEPRSQLETQPVQAMPAAVAGGASDHFAPRDPRDDPASRTLADLLGLTPTRSGSDSTTRTIVDPVVETIAEPVVETIAEPLLEPVSEPLTEPLAEPLTDPLIEPLPVEGVVGDVL